MTTITCSIDLDAPGRHVGDLRLRWSDNSVPLGYHPIPIVSLRAGPGPVALLIAGTHGDEFEGPAALMRLVDGLDLAEITGQILALPALNTPAVAASSRVSPLDGANLNRAFPGDPSGAITAQIAAYVETVLMPRASGAVDLHSGGKASVFAPCTLATRTANAALYAQNLALAAAFGLPLTWVLGAFNDGRSLNSAAERAGVPMIATELGGGGGVDPQITDATEDGLRAMLAHLGVLSGPVAPVTPRKVEVTAIDHSLFAPGEGVFDRKLSAGDAVTAGQRAGHIHYVTEPRRPSEPVIFPTAGVILAHTNRGYVARGDLLYLVAHDTP